MDTIQRNQGYKRIDARRRLLRASARRVQADAQRKNGVIEEALVETLGCSGMTHSAAMAGEILPGKTLLEALNTDLVCDAINVAMRELFLQIVYGRTQSAFSDDGLPVGAGLEDLGKGLRSQVGTYIPPISKA